MNRFRWGHSVSLPRTRGGLAAVGIALGLSIVVIQGGADQAGAAVRPGH